MQVVNALGERLRALLDIPTYADEIAAAKAGFELPHAQLRTTAYRETRLGCGGVTVYEQVESEPLALIAEVFKIDASWQLDIFGHYERGGNRQLWQLAESAKDAVRRLRGERFTLDDSVFFVKHVGRPGLVQLPVDTGIEPFLVGVRMSFDTIIHRLEPPKEIPLTTQIEVEFEEVHG